jgi:hypothetical protein
MDSNDGIDYSYEADVPFGTNQSVYRVSLKAEKPENGGLTGASIGSLSLGATGMLAGATALVMSAVVKKEDEHADYQTLGVAALAGGAALVTLGIVLLNINRGTVREGRYIQFPLAAGNGN